MKKRLIGDQKSLWRILAPKISSVSAKNHSDLCKDFKNTKPKIVAKTGPPNVTFVMYLLQIVTEKVTLPT